MRRYKVALAKVAMQTWGANFVEVGVDRDLGLIRLRRVVARYSAGRIINPMAAKSQMICGIIWEWGEATMEASLVEPRYGRFLARNLSMVVVPVNADIPADAFNVGFVEATPLIVEAASRTQPQPQAFAAVLDYSLSV
ncbi:molybdopterin cofactor-binding domain-containing protein [Neorhizobium sp. DAR64872/K0K18]|uniref:molybdopterin cofactor-binding domain-containing protein n=1 Tax=Neorhizobium sp. DAR64872/K0K18 TaxID=3421958 RepID=UPI003D26AF9B